MRVLISTLSFLFILVSFCHAQTSITLKEAISLALQNNREIKALEENLQAQKKEITITQTHLLPKITFEERFMRTNNPTYSFMSKLNQGRFTESDFYIPNLNNPTPTNDFQTVFSFEQPIFVRKLNVYVDMAKKVFDTKGYELNRKKEELAYRVIQSYIAIKTIKGFIDASKKAVEEAEEILRIADLRYKNALGLLSDRLRAETALLEARQRLLKVEKDLNIAKRSLGLLLSRDEAIDIVDDQQIEFIAKSLDEYLKHSELREDIKAMSKKVETAADNIELAKAEYYPTVGIGASYQMNDPKRLLGREGDSWQLVAFLRWNIFDSFKRNYEYQKATHQKNEAQFYLQQMKSHIKYSVFEAFENYDLAKSALLLAEKNLKTAEEGKRLIKVRYENGLSPIVDLLNAQSVLDLARSNLNEKTNALYLAIANLKLQSGILLKELKLQ
ncbi:MAG: TolC family protein [Thermodesulfovibrionales bacterium]|nr:TolC family protein [Thermodesulfovibrionales bacterium]